MPNWTFCGTESSTSSNACLAADIRDCPSMSLARIEPLTSSTSSTFGDACATGSSAAAVAGSSPQARTPSRPQPSVAVSSFLMIIRRMVVKIMPDTEVGRSERRRRTMGENKRRMLAGEWYLPDDPELGAESLRRAELCRAYNGDPLDAAQRTA